MKYILLCGGIGFRNNNYSLPKPLNYINGKHLIEYIIESIPSNELYIIYNSMLDVYNFKGILNTKFKHLNIYFSSIDFLTRGAVETAYIGIQNFNLQDDNILFIDNDNIYKFPQFNKYSNNFIYYNIDYENPNFSFITISEDGYVTNIEEKNKISNYYCCGLYGFINKQTFDILAEELLKNNLKTKNEFYMSNLYKLLLKNNQLILPIRVEETSHLGTYKEILQYKPTLKKRLKICFNLYSECTDKSIKLINDLYDEGHEIIIFTSLNMKDVNLKYHKLISEPEIGDIYINDRAVNLNFQNISTFGLFEHVTCRGNEDCLNKIENNCFNSIIKIDNIIHKKGPVKYLEGELYFYQNIPEIFKEYFPNYISFNNIKEDLEIKIEYIRGIPLYYLYKNRTLTFNHIDQLFEILNKFHNYKYINNRNITINNIKNNYIKKLKDRYNKEDYTFKDSEEIFNQIINNIEQRFNPIIVNLIHGDFWFSNIILTYDDKFKFIDMRGKVDNINTLYGDLYYDYAKLYQSILGYDLLLHEDKIDQIYINSYKEYFLKKCTDNYLDILYLRSITKSLIFGTFPFLKNKSLAVKQSIWNLIITF